MIDEQNKKLVDIYRQKAEEYFDRAAYLKKQVLTKPEPVKEGAAGGGGGGGGHGTGGGSDKK